MDAAPEARRFFEALSYSKKLALVTKMNVKNADMRKERIEATVAQLQAGKASARLPIASNTPPSLG